jgi:hypothetical protein
MDLTRELVTKALGDVEDTVLAEVRKNWPKREPG